MKDNDTGIAERDSQDSKWHVDKRIPLALIAMISMQTFAALWWASGINTRVNELESEYHQLALTPGQIIRLQTQLESISSNIADIKNALLRDNSPRNLPR